MTPLARFTIDLKRIHFLPPNQTSDELFFYEESRKVKKDNTFPCKNVRYEVPADLRNRTITIRYDRSKMDRVIVYYKNQRIGEAKALDYAANSKVKRGAR